MKITIFTSNQPRHISLIETLSKIADDVCVFMEVNTLYPGQIEDFYKKSEVMQHYFKNVVDAESKIFGNPRFLPSNARVLPMKMHDLNFIDIHHYKEIIDSDYFIVFGSTYIKGALIDFLVDRGAINIHMGISPYYRGSSCNFWACFDNNFDKVGATIHLLSKGLDSGDILMHCFPSYQENPFQFTMQAVKSAHFALAEYISKQKKIAPIKQDKSTQIRYTKNADFTDSVAQNFLDRQIFETAMKESIEKRIMSTYFNPVIF